MTTGERMRLIREKRGMTQKQVADGCGMADSAIRKYESGQVTPKPVTLQRIADALGVHLLDLMGIGVAFDGYNIEIKAYLPDNREHRETIADVRDLYNSLSPEAKAEFLETMYRASKEKLLASSDISEEAYQIAKSYETLTEHGKGAVKAILEYEEKSLSHKNPLP